jgi:hypothetical protein
VDNLLAVVLRDFSGTPVGAMEVDCLWVDPRCPEELAEVLPDARDWLDPEASEDSRLLLRVRDGRGGDHVTALEPRAGRESLLVEIASNLQDHVVDEMSRPWPEADLGQVGRHVLDVYISPGGRAVWGYLRGAVEVCAVGELADFL